MDASRTVRYWRVCVVRRGKVMTEEEKHAAAEKARRLLKKSGMAVERVDVDVVWLKENLS